MEKRFILFILICLVLFPLYTRIFLPSPEAAPPANPTAPGAAGTADPVAIPPPAGASPGPAAPVPAPPTEPSAAAYPSRVLLLENPTLRVRLRSEGAGIESVSLPAYREVDRDAELLLAAPELASGTGLVIRTSGGAMGTGPALDAAPWEVIEESATRAVFRHPLPGGSVTKTFELPAEGYELEVAIEIACDPALARDAVYQLLGPERIRFDPGSTHPNQRIAGIHDARGRVVDTDHESVGPLAQRVRVDERRISWGGLESNYFACVIRPLRDGAGPVPKLVEVADPDDSRAAEYKDAHELGRQTYPYRVGFQLPIESGRTDRFRVFLGPKDPGVLGAYAEHGYKELIDYGSMLGWLVRLFLFLLRTFEAVTGSWGLAIILLTVLVKTLLHPVNKRNQRTMQRQQKKMAAIQPEMRAVREKYKNDPLKANQEIQKLFREHGVNPAQMFGGCMMIFLQLPIWIGLINTFRLAIELRLASFLWIDDLTAPDHVLELPFRLPFYDSPWFNVLPVLYVIVTLISQRMMPRSDDPQMRQQQKMMTFMMVAFGFIFYEFASGLMLYFLTSASLGILEQKIIRAELRHEEAKAVAAGAVAPGSSGPAASKPAPAGPALPKARPAKPPKPKRPR